MSDVSGVLIGDYTRVLYLSIYNYFYIELFLAVRGETERET